MPLISADAIYTPQGWATDRVLDLTAEGEVRTLRPRQPGEAVAQHRGLLVPGWVNAHCHLELTALGGKIDEATGMTGFIGQLFRARAQLSGEKLQAGVQEGLAYLAQTGTAAVGDISNLPVSAEPKRQSSLYSHTFIELLGLAPAEAAERLAQGRQLAQSFADLPHSLTPHAPYSTSAELFRQIYASGSDRFSLHLLESAAETELFNSGRGPFLDFYHRLGLPFAPFADRDPQKHALQDAPVNIPLILVHLTELPDTEVANLVSALPQAWFCLCPRSNWFIHRRQPAVEAWAAHPDRVCLGTDSLASNYSLDLWEEVRWLQERYPSLGLHKVIRWATTNGAQALGIAKKFGTFAPASKPGVLLIERVSPVGQGWRLTPQSSLRLLFPGQRQMFIA